MLRSLEPGVWNVPAIRRSSDVFDSSGREEKNFPAAAKRGFLVVCFVRRIKMDKNDRAIFLWNGKG
jgi:hypothetical protein